MKPEGPRGLPPEAPGGLAGDATVTYDPSRTEIYSSGEGMAPTGWEHDDAPAVPPPDTVRFQMRRFIDRGGYGEVWEATQVSLNRTVAIKRLREDVISDPAESIRQLTSFRREAMTTASLEHPNIVPVYDSGVDDRGQPQLAMRLVRGDTWQSMLERDRALPSAEFLARHLPVLTDVAQAVAYAHSRGFIHRDIKPSQVLVGEFGEVFLVDWGLAVFVGGDGSNVDIDGGSVACPAGTPAYMAPEQTDNVPDRLGPWTDVYLLGGTLHYLLTGDHPRASDSASRAFVMAAMGRADLQLGGEPDEEIPEDLDRLVRDAMAADPASRPSASRFIDVLQDHLSGAGKRRESTRLTDEVYGILSRGVDGYDLLSRCLSKLDRAEGLWTSNPEIGALRERALTIFATTALANGDLELARRQAQRLTDEGTRIELTGIIRRKAERYRHTARQRRFFAVASLVLGAVLVASGVKYAVDQRTARLRIAEQRNAAIAARLQAESLAGFMLGDLTSSLEGLGRLDLLDRVAEETVSYYRSQPADQADSDTVLRRSLAMRNASRVLRGQGEVSGARAAIDESVSLVRGLADQDPDHPELRRQLADRLLELGLLMEQTSDPDAAIAAYSESLALFDALLADHPTDVELRRGLARSLSGLGYERWARAEFDAALEMLRRADATLLELVDERAADLESTRLLLEARARMGGVLRDRGDLEAASVMTRDAVAIGDALIEASPGNVVNLAALAECASSLGFTLWQMDDLHGALEAYRNAYAIDLELAERDPSNHQRQRNLAGSLSNVGEMLRGLGDVDGALRSQTTAVEILTPLVEENPDQADWRYALATAELELGNLQAMMGDAARANEAWQAAADHIRVVALERGDLYYLDTYVRALLLLGRRQEARPIVDELRARGWRSSSFSRLCEISGL